MSALNVLCAQLTRDLFAIAKFLSKYGALRSFRTTGELAVVIVIAKIYNLPHLTFTSQQ